MSIKGYKDANGNIQKYDINSLDAPFTAEVGQVLVVESVDKNGYPNGFSVIDQANGVEITDGEPTKESTVMTLDPNAEEVNLYTAPEIDEMLQNLPSGSGGDAIIDVIALPTEDIKEDSFYRLLTGKLVINQVIQNMYKCYCVEALPEVGEPATNIEQTEGNVYYNITDGELYGYVNDMLSMGLSVPAGWYTASILLGALGFGYNGVITDIMDDPRDGAFRFLLEYEIYSYKEGKWTSHKVIGKAGTGRSAEVFNHTSNKATGECSHAEGYASHAEGNYSHAEGISSRAEGISSHAEGNSSYSKGDYSHAEGYASHAEGNSSHAEGCGTIASSYDSHAQGKYNIEDTEKKYAHIVGNGASDINRSNAHTLDWQGNAEFQGDVVARGCGGENPISLIGLSEKVENLPSGGSDGGNTKWQKIINYITTEEDLEVTSLWWSSEQYPLLKKAKGFILVTNKPAQGSTSSSAVTFSLNGISLGNITTSMSTATATLYTSRVAIIGNRIAFGTKNTTSRSTAGDAAYPSLQMNWDGSFKSIEAPDEIESVSIGSFSAGFIPVGVEFTLYAEVVV